MSKPSGPSRIPTFGSRIPTGALNINPPSSSTINIINKPKCPTSSSTISASSPICDVNTKHLGRKVRVGEDKQGILRFIGTVHFAKGVWCGVELSDPVGKNDGIVHGVRYFTCPRLHGLLAHASKVSVMESNCECLDDVSGPYSMLFIQSQPSELENNTYNIQEQNSEDSSNNTAGNSSDELNQTVIANDPQNLSSPRRRTYDKDELFANEPQNLSSATRRTYDKDELFPSKNTTFQLKENSNVFGPNTCNSNENNTFVTYNHERNTKSSYSQLNQDTADLVIDKRRTYGEDDLVPCKNNTFELNDKCTVYNSSSNPGENNTFVTYNQDISGTVSSTSSNRNQTYINNQDAPNSTLPLGGSNTFTTYQQKEVLNPRKTSYGSEHSPNYTFEANKKNTFSVTDPKLSENQLNESGVDIKRFKTSKEPKNLKIDSLILKNLPESLEKPSSLPQLRSFSHNYDSALTLNKFSHSTPIRGEFTESLLRKLQVNFDNTQNLNDDDSSKRDSLEFEESLGILTPEQMVDGILSSFASSFTRSRSPSGEFAIVNNKNKKCSEPSSPKESSLDVTKTNLDIQFQINQLENNTELLQSPNLVDASITDYSLGILDEHMLSNLTLKTDTTMNMELPLDTIDKSKDYTLTRLEQTPSPEELPLDPTPVQDSTDPNIKIESNVTKSKSKTTTNSFITSITTSITSLDTGYQGDGEMSRPASRGGDNSPLTRRPIQRNQPRRADPMTDSDFYTESDADNHDENHLRGDRRAQVIDGTLYGVDPQAAADIYANNRENMDSSGIFTDIESNTRTEELPEPNVQSRDITPSDASSKTISENSQDNIQEILLVKSGNLSENINNAKKDSFLAEKTPSKKDNPNPKKRNAPSPVVSSPSSALSPRHSGKDDSLVKKYKMPKRDVASKVKQMMETGNQQQNQTDNVNKNNSSGVIKTFKKPVNRWDAVLNKISKTEQKTNLKDVKSRVFCNVTNNLNSQRQNDVRKTNLVKQNGSGQQKSPNVKSRRIRSRATPTTASPKNSSNLGSSIHSSLSDLSATATPPKKLIGSAKKRDVVQVTQVLTASKLSPRNQQNSTESKKSANPTASRNQFSPKEKKQAANKECARGGTVKGGRTSPAVRPPSHQTRVPAKQVPRVAEALAVLVQHLVFNVEAYQVPSLRREVEKFRLEAEEIRLACQQLEETLAEERSKQARAIEEERVRCRNDITEIIEKHRNQMTQLTNEHMEKEERLKSEKDTTQKHLCKTHEDQLMTLKTEFSKLQRTHEEALEILREENDAIREQIDEERTQTDRAKHESLKLREDYEQKEMLFKEQTDFLQQENQRLVKLVEKLEKDVGRLEGEIADRVVAAEEENKKLRDENDRLLSYGDDKGIGMQEVQSLRAVLELKQTEVSELRKNLAEVTQKADILAGAEERASALNARCEDLQLQLQRKSEYEQNLISENQKLQESFKEESNQKKRLCQYNEELQWKLKQNKEVITKVLEQAEESVFNRSFTSSFNERHSSTTKQHLERTLSFRERSLSNKSLENSIRKSKMSTAEFDDEDLSPPSSPKVKGVVEKSDSVSYVLDLDESPDVVASRIVRRSFRNTTPPKNTPTKSPCNKRPRYKNPLSLSASASSITTNNSNKEDYYMRSVSLRNNEDCFNPICTNNDFNVWSSANAVTTSTPRQQFHHHDSSPVAKVENHLDLDEECVEDDIQLPALPSELDKQRQKLPSPQHLAGEAMVSESNSDDESTSSSQL